MSKSRIDERVLLLTVILMVAFLVSAIPHHTHAEEHAFTIECIGTIITYTCDGQRSEKTFTDTYSIDLITQRFADLEDPSNVRTIAAVEGSIVYLQRSEGWYGGRPFDIRTQVDMSDWSYEFYHNFETWVDNREGTCAIIEFVPLQSE